MPDQKQGDGKREVADKTTPSSETNTTKESSRAPGVPEPQKGGPESPSKGGVITGDKSGNK